MTNTAKCPYCGKFYFKIEPIVPSEKQKCPHCGKDPNEGNPFGNIDDFFNGVFGMAKS